MHIQSGQLSSLLTVTGPFTHNTPGTGCTSPRRIPACPIGRPGYYSLQLTGEETTADESRWDAPLRPVRGPGLFDLQAPCSAPPSTATPSPWTLKISVQKDDPKPFRVYILPRTTPSHLCTGRKALLGAGSREA